MTTTAQFETNYDGSFAAYDNSDRIDHEMKLMIDFDDIFSEVIASFDPIGPGNYENENDNIENVLSPPTTTSTTTSSAYMPAQTYQASQNYYHHVPAVSPSSSYNGLNEYSSSPEDFSVEPTKLSEMAPPAAAAPSTVIKTVSMQEIPICISPSPSDASSSVAPAPASHQITAPAKRKASASSSRKSSATTANKKRRISAVAASSSTVITTTESTQESDGLVALDDETIQEQRRQRNRDHARKSRQRKKSLTGSLQQSLEELKAENAKLREQIYAAIGQAKTETMMKTKLLSPEEQFVTAFTKKPENRILDAESISFLQGLKMKLLANKNNNHHPVQMVA